jgi:hypothetical protein
LVKVDGGHETRGEHGNGRIQVRFTLACRQDLEAVEMQPAEEKLGTQVILIAAEQPREPSSVVNRVRPQNYRGVSPFPHPCSQAATASRASARGSAGEPVASSPLSPIPLILPAIEFPGL